MILKLQDHDYLGENLFNEYEWLNEVHLTVEDANLKTIFVVSLPFIKTTM